MVPIVGNYHVDPSGMLRGPLRDFLEGMSEGFGVTSA